MYKASYTKLKRIVRTHIYEAFGFKSDLKAIKIDWAEWNETNRKYTWISGMLEDSNSRNNIDFLININDIVYLGHDIVEL